MSRKRCSTVWRSVSFRNVWKKGLRMRTTPVDGFIRFSLSVHNRRKSRMGHSLEHHLEAMFQAFGIAYDRGKATENNHRPDFLFPSVALTVPRLPQNLKI